MSEERLVDKLEGSALMVDEPCVILSQKDVKQLYRELQAIESERDALRVEVKNLNELLDQYR